MSDDWLPLSDAPRDQTIIEGLFPDGKVRTMAWAWGGGWMHKIPSRYKHLGWVSFNDENQPTAWRPIKEQAA